MDKNLKAGVVVDVEHSKGGDYPAVVLSVEGKFVVTRPKWGPEGRVNQWEHLDGKRFRRLDDIDNDPAELTVLVGVVA